MNQPPAPPARQPSPRVPVLATVREALLLIRDFPRETLAPMFAVEAPVALISALVTAILYVTVFRNEPVHAAGELLDKGAGGPLFAFLAVTAFELLFAQVARGATIVGVAAARRGEHLPLAQLLDPAFTRMGGLLMLAVVTSIIGVVGVALSVTIIGALLAIFIFIRWAVAFETYMLEGQRVFGALAESWARMRGSMLRYLGVLLVSLGVVVLPFFAISMLQLAVGGSRSQEIATTAVVTALQGILVVPLLAFLTAVTTVFYFNLKEQPVDRNSAGE